MGLFGAFGRWIVLAAVTIVVLGAFSLLNAFQTVRTGIARQLQPTRPLDKDQYQHYLALSQAAEYIVYGRVIAELPGITRNIYPEPNNPSLVIPISRHRFSVDVIRYAVAQGAGDGQALLPNRITLSEGDTTHSARFEIGELFFAFVRKHRDEDTYHVVGLTAGSLEGKFSVVIRNNQPYLASGITVTHLLDITSRSP